MAASCRLFLHAVVPRHHSRITYLTQHFLLLSLLLVMSGTIESLDASSTSDQDLASPSFPSSSSSSLIAASHAVPQSISRRSMSHPVTFRSRTPSPTFQSRDSNYSFPDAPDAVKSAHVINETSSITDADGHRMHIMEGDVAVPDHEEHVHDEAVNEINKFPEPDDDSGRKSSKYAIRDDYRIWPRGRIPYVIDGSLWNERGIILKAMKHIMSKTCITFTPRRSWEKNFIRIYQGSYRSCFSMIGRIGGGQGISLGKGCLVHGVIVHELMHAIGFYHMHSRSDRDRYLKILWSNIDEDMQSQFRRNAKSQDILFRPFDFRSIMLYGPKLFSRNGQDTMIPLRRGARLLDTGVKTGLSDEDARSINMLYGCESRDHSSSLTPPSSTSSTTTPSYTSSTTTTTSTTTESSTSTSSTQTPETSMITISSVTVNPTKRRRRKYKPRQPWHKYWDKQRQGQKQQQDS